MDVNGTLREMFIIAKEWEEIKIFNRNFMLNNTELEIVTEVIGAETEGKKIISSEIAKMLGITRSAVSQIIKKLEDRDVLKRIPDDKDKKIAYVILGDKAIAVYEHIKEKLSKIVDRTLDRIGCDTVESTLNNIKTLIKVFKEELEAERKNTNI